LEGVGKSPRFQIVFMQKRTNSAEGHAVICKEILGSNWGGEPEPQLQWFSKLLSRKRLLSGTARSAPIIGSETPLLAFANRSAHFAE
jgi:hypothetical protein